MVTDHDAVDRLVANLARPIYNYRMGTGMLNKKAGKARVERAKEEIREAIKQYAADAMLEVT